MAVIRTDDLSATLRSRAIRPETREILISRLDGSKQESDLTDPPNCGGYGRIRHFKLDTPSPWPSNPLPILPAAHRLGISVTEAVNAQVFQNAACNWRCWYCFVPFNLLAANEATSKWFSAQQLVDLYLQEPDRPRIIDCSGGQPDLVPEWIPWMIKALKERGIEDKTFLWSDDNLSNDYFWRFCTAAQRRAVTDHKNYGRVCCFKGYNATSFAFNTKADPGLFDRQFELFGRLLQLGIDIYAYATFTAPDDKYLSRDMRVFVDRLQAIHRNIPLRLVPLQIQAFGVALPRVGDIHQYSMRVQETAVAA